MKKPYMNVEGMNGNIFNVAGQASRVLRRAGQSNKVQEMRGKITKCGSYDEALAVVSQYVEMGFGK